MFRPAAILPLLQALLTQLRADSTYEANHRQQLDTACTQDGDTPLIAAARGGHYQVVELLLNSGASLHPQTQRQGGGTALHEAIARRQDHVIDLLLAAGTNSFVENAQGFTPLDVACSLRNVDLLRRLESGAPWSGWLLMKVTRLGGLGTEWQRRWVVVSHRESAAEPRRLFPACPAPFLGQKCSFGALNTHSLPGTQSTPHSTNPHPYRPSLSRDCTILCTSQWESLPICVTTHVFRHPLQASLTLPHPQTDAWCTW